MIRKTLSATATFLFFLLIHSVAHAGGGEGCSPSEPVTQDVAFNNELALITRELNIKKIESINEEPGAAPSRAYNCTICAKSTYSYLELGNSYKDTIKALREGIDKPQTFSQVEEGLKQTAAANNTGKTLVSFRNVSSEQALSYLDNYLKPGRSALIDARFKQEFFDSQGELSRTVQARHIFVVLKGTAKSKQKYTPYEMRGRVRFDIAIKTNIRDVLTNEENSELLFWYEYPDINASGGTIRLSIIDNTITVLIAEEKP
ncbi:MAG: hypothetical protein ACR2PT_12485 [Endozoicomonas sp.]